MKEVEGGGINGPIIKPPDKWFLIDSTRDSFGGVIRWRGDGNQFPSKTTGDRNLRSFIINPPMNLIKSLPWQKTPRSSNRRN